MFNEDERERIREWARDMGAAAGKVVNDAVTAAVTLPPDGAYFVSYDSKSGTCTTRPVSKAGSATPELHCPLPGCGKENDAGVRVCWNCGNELGAKR